MAFINMPNIYGGVDLTKIRNINGTKYVTDSATNFSNGNEFDLLHETIPSGAYLTNFYVSISDLFSTHTYDTSTFLHFCLVAEFNVYIDGSLFQTIRLSYSKSGTPASTTNIATESANTCAFDYQFYAKELVMGATVDIDSIPHTIDAFVLDTSSEMNVDNQITLSTKKFRPQGIACGEQDGFLYYVGQDSVYLDSANDDIHYGTICPMVKIDRRIRITAKYLAFNNCPDATNTATFRSVIFDSSVSVIPY